MDWLHSVCNPLDEATFAYATVNGNLDDLKWLQSVGCPWDEETFALAANNGDIDNMKWLYSEGFLWDKLILKIVHITLILRILSGMVILII